MNRSISKVHYFSFDRKLSFNIKLPLIIWQFCGLRGSGIDFGMLLAILKFILINPKICQRIFKNSISFISTKIDL